MNIVSAESEIRIDREPEVVFAYFADLRNEPEWDRGHVKKSCEMEKIMRTLSEFSHNHHTSVVKMLAKYIRRGISA